MPEHRSVRALIFAIGHYHSFAAVSTVRGSGVGGPFQRRTGLRAAAVSSMRLTRVACGAVQDEMRVLFDFARDLLHGVDEEVELFLRFALGGLDHERAGDDEREARRCRGGSRSR